MDSAIMLMVAIFMLSTCCVQVATYPCIVSDPYPVEILSGVETRCTSVAFDVVDIRVKLCNTTGKLKKQVLDRFKDRFTHWTSAAWYKTSCANITSSTCRRCLIVDGTYNYLYESCLTVSLLHEEFCQLYKRRPKRSLSEAEVLEDLSGVTRTLSDFSTAMHQEFKPAAPAQTVLFQTCNQTTTIHVQKNSLINTHCDCRYSSASKVYVRRSQCKQDFAGQVVRLEVRNLRDSIKELAKMRDVADAIHTNVQHSTIVSAVDSLLKKTDIETVKLKKALRDQIKQHNAELGLLGLPKNVIYGVVGGVTTLLIIGIAVCCACKLLKLQRGL